MTGTIKEIDFHREPKPVADNPPLIFPLELSKEISGDIIGCMISGAGEACQNQLSSLHDKKDFLDQAEQTLFNILSKDTNIASLMQDKNCKEIVDIFTHPEVYLQTKGKIEGLAKEKGMDDRAKIGLEIMISGVFSRLLEIRDTINQHIGIALGEKRNEKLLLLSKIEQDKLVVQPATVMDHNERGEQTELVFDITDTTVSPPVKKHYLKRKGLKDKPPETAASRAVSVAPLKKFLVGERRQSVTGLFRAIDLVKQVKGKYAGVKISAQILGGIRNGNEARMSPRIAKAILGMIRTKDGGEEKGKEFTKLLETIYLANYPYYFKEMEQEPLVDRNSGIGSLF